MGRLPWWVKFSGQQLRIMAGIVLTGAVLFWGWRLTVAWNQRTWFGFEPYRVLMMSEPEGNDLPSIEVLSIWPDTLKTVAIAIPPEMMIAAVGGYGNYRVAGLIELGRIEGVGDRLLKDSLGYALGIPIHQVYKSKTGGIHGSWWPVLRQVVWGQRSAPEAVAIAQLLWAAKSGTPDKISLTEKNVLREKTEDDESVGLYFESALIDRVIYDSVRTFWREAAMLEVAVINASGKPMMASSWSRLPRVAGFDVVSVTDQQELSDKTAIIFSDKQTMNAPWGKVLTHLFPRAEVMVGEVGKYRAQTVIMLGRDSWEWLTNREEYLGKKE